MSGLGAWSFGYYHQGMAVPNNRVGEGIIAFKRALVDNGHNKGIDLSIKKFGLAMKNRTIDFQNAEGITADGVIGPTTASHLFRHYSYSAENNVGIPDHLLQKLGRQESGHDPVAQGYVDPKDEGWAQINLTYHPKITQQQAWTPSFAIPWAGDVLAGFYHNEVADWDGAIASYNIGEYYAKLWVEAGKPSSGEVVNGIDLYQRATRYVDGVKSQPA